MKDLERAKERLTLSSCVLAKGERVKEMSGKGVSPLLLLIDSGEDFSGFAAADKVVGRAAAFLYILLKVKSVYADVMSKGALKILKNANIYAEYGVLTENIRRPDGQLCPMEEAVSGETEAQAAAERIRERVRSLQKNV